jgi:hypothetical protein
MLLRPINILCTPSSLRTRLPPLIYLRISCNIVTSVPLSFPFFLPSTPILPLRSDIIANIFKRKIQYEPPPRHWPLWPPVNYIWSENMNSAHQIMSLVALGLLLVVVAPGWVPHRKCRFPSAVEFFSQEVSPVQLSRLWLAGIIWLIAIISGFWYVHPVYSRPTSLCPPTPCTSLVPCRFIPQKMPNYT